MNLASYKGYMAHIGYSTEDECFVGHLTGIRDIVGFHGDSAEEVTTALREAVDDYLSACVQLGSEPNKPATSR